MKFSITVALLLILFTSCEKQPKNVVEFEQWFTDEENGYVRTKTAGSIYVKVQERPAGLMVLNEVSEKKANVKSIDSLMQNYSNSTYFLIEIGFTEQAEGNKDLITERAPITYSQYSKLIDQLSFGLEKNVFLVNGKDTIKPIMYNYERGYELGKKEKMIFMFPKVENKKKEFVYIDEIFGMGIVKLQFDPKAEPPKLTPELFDSKVN